jgi:nitrite reductase (NADH) small subunit/3-phenylpropionate/trans-cinnamate dioxygenase ferredoxin subunit
VGELVKIGRRSEFREGRGRAVSVGGVSVAVFRTPSGFVAIADTCPHMGASLADGRLTGPHVECAWHGWKFDVSTGRSDVRDWACVHVYEVLVEGEDVLIRRPDPPPPREEAPEEEWEVFDPEKHLKRGPREPEQT